MHEATDSRRCDCRQEVGDRQTDRTRTRCADARRTPANRRPCTRLPLLNMSGQACLSAFDLSIGTQTLTPATSDPRGGAMEVLKVKGRLSFLRTEALRAHLDLFVSAPASQPR